MEQAGTYWPKLAQGRASRRRVLKSGLAGAGAVAAAAAVGCAPSGGPAARRRAGPPAGGALRFATALPVSYGLDPQAERGTGLEIFPRLYGYLHHVDPQRDDALVLDHAARVEQADAATLLLRLRPDVRFQDVAPTNGRSVAAADVVASVLRYRDHPLAVNKLWHLTVLDRIDAPDAYTVRVVTKRPYAYSLQVLGDIAAGAILPKEAIDSHADLRAASAGSGPFALDKADAAAGIWRIVRNAAYFGSRPYVDAMQWRVFADDASKAAAFGRREFEVMDARDAAEAQSAQVAGVLVDAKPSLAWLSLGLRLDAAPLADPRVREAIDLALDRDALIRGIAPAGGVVLGPVNPHLAGGYWSLPEADVRAAFGGSRQPDERVARARALLAAAGAPAPSLALQTVNTPRMIDVATAVREQLRSAGLDVRIDELEPLAWFVNFRKGAFQMTLIPHEPYESPDIPTRFFHSRGIDGTGNMFALRDANIDALVERSWGESRRSLRRATLLDAQRQMLASRAMLQLFTNAGYTATWEDVQGRGAQLVGSFAQYNYRQWLETPADRARREKQDAAASS
ncbi:MAG: ABC transporter substrate-binding protein [Dehalococcoidia bacterium]|nr:ABC transporter substrate-binding protein [Dehalococcoidia bacterium]